MCYLRFQNKVLCVFALVLATVILNRNWGLMFSGVFNTPVAEARMHPFCTLTTPFHLDCIPSTILLYK